MHPVFKLLLAVFLLALNLYGASRLYPPGRWQEKLGVLGGGCAVVLLLSTVLRACYPGTFFPHVPILSVGSFLMGMTVGRMVRAQQSSRRLEMTEHPRFYAFYHAGIQLFFTRVMPIGLSFSQVMTLFH